MLAPCDIAAELPLAVACDLSRQVLRAARADATNARLGFAGSLSAAQASTLFKAGVGRLVDVRADIELDLEGFVPGSIHVPWAVAPHFEVNPAFVSELEQKVAKDEVLLFHCRRGSRSAAAATAATEAGFRNAFSINGSVDELLALCVDRSTTTW
jgi:rhodanese-related sulfurtransferase